MSIEKNRINGSWVISDIVNGYLVTRVYYGYSKKDAKAIFRAEIKELK